MDQEKKITQQDTILQYVNGELTGDALQRFELAMSEDTDLKQEVEYYQQLGFVISNERLFRVKNLISDITKVPTPPAPPQSSIRRFFGWPWMLVSLALVVGIVGAIQWRQAAKHETILNQFVQPFERIINTSPETEPLLRDGMAAYDRQEYDLAASLLDEYVGSQPKNVYAQLYAGISHLLNNEPQRAQAIFENLSVIEDGVVKSTAQWYLALTYIKLGNKEEAEPLLSALKADPVFEKKVNQLRLVLADW